MKKKGFTLVELLAVIVILAVVAVISIPIILNVIENAKEKGYKESAIGYVDAIEKKIAIEKIKNINTDYTGEYSIKEDKITKTSETASLLPILDNISLKLKVKGILPNKGNVIIGKKGVTSGKFYYGDYLVTLNGEKYKVELVTNSSEDVSEDQSEDSGDLGKTVVLRFSGSQALTCNSQNQKFTNLTVNAMTANSNDIFSVSGGTVTITKAGYYNLNIYAYENGNTWRNMTIQLNDNVISGQSVTTGTGSAQISSSTSVYIGANSRINLGYWCNASNTMYFATLSVTYLHS